MIRHLLCGTALFLGLAAAAKAASAPVSLFLFSPVQTSEPGDAVSGIRLGLIYGLNSSLTGIDAGGVNRLTSSLTGVQWSGWGTVEGDVTGAQLNWISAQSKGHVLGLQIGLVNMSDTMDGLQIGLVNAIRSGGAFPVFPFVNWSF